MNVGISGHQKMPKEAYDYAAGFIDDYLAGYADVTGVSSLAAGADQMFAEKIVGTDNQLYVVIPCKNYESTFDEQGLSKYTKLLNAATRTETLDYDDPSEEAFYAAGKRVAELADELIAVWDGKEAQGLGGTADIVRYAKELGKHAIIVWPEGVER